ncbi:Mitochondrial import inner membrane translocase subunit tim23 [Malassezia vespertilionis]|uniref:Tim23p n=1 Tax=Malassezia vespertilionis TaxID=2020962 RepID=A0A2N1JBH7_9BASI|nr:Mitochondrial import inner membrane translocase subunit tim23 [Malassezia vespertilionis]PKI83904.1 Tim23p [Malassezia vespertilionis]WFD07041.1 Mitochondrial import inner membrane translocase subunit tim23 [Malassezia vespertilionis]
MWPFSSSRDSNAPPAPAVPEHVGEGTVEHLRQQSFVTPSDTAPPEAPTAASLLQHTALDPAKLHPFANISSDDLEYLDIEDDKPNTLQGSRTALPSRGWSDDLCYGTGTTYLSGLALGGLMGLREGAARPLGIEHPTFRLRMNAVLNQVTRRSTFVGNSAGVIAMTYNIVDAIIDNARGKHDIYGSMASGALSGALFRVTSGPRAMLVSSSIMVAAAAAWTGAKRAFLS